MSHGDGRLGPDKPLAPGQILGIVSVAYRDGRCIWPGRREPLLRRFWVARYYLLQPARLAWCAVKAILARGRGGPSSRGAAPGSHNRPDGVRR